MRIALYDYRFRHARPYLEAFARGLLRCGQDFVRVPLGAPPVLCDLAVVWSYWRRDVIAAQRLSGGRLLVLERGYLGDRKRWISVGYDGLNGRADFCNSAADDRRFREYFEGLLQPWKRSGEYILVMGQCRHDQSVRHLDMLARLTDAIRAIRTRSDWPVRFRPHPEDPETPAPPGSTVIAGALQEAMSNAHCVVTINSNSGVDAAVAGVPVIALDRGSMAWPVAGHRAAEAIRPPRPDRERWAAELAWCQWTTEEIAAGDCWAHMRKGMQRARRSPRPPAGMPGTKLSPLIGARRPHDR